MKVLHVFDHTIPLHSGYTFRSLALLKGQRALGWETHHLSSPKHSAGLGDKADGALEQTVDGWHFYRTPDLPSSSLPVLREDGRWANRAFVIDSAGNVAARYDKLHMFDVDLATGESWRESNAYAPGDGPVVVQTPLGKLGLTICYDLRFPALFEYYGRAQVDLIAIPAAFTVPTGQAHWHVLQRARAIEATAYVVSAAQVGRHEDGRETFGHSLVIDPWGEVLLDMGGETAGLSFAELDPARIAAVRSQVPCLANKRTIPT